MSDLVGQRLGQYRLSEVIRRGGMSTVYKAHQASLDRWVAVKVLAHPGDPQFVARFEREARSIARLQHPNIVPIHDYGEQDGQVFLVVQYVEDGRSLEDLLGRPLEVVPALELIGHVLAALGYAHEAGIVHRDVKPGNVLLPSETWPMLADFGIAKVLMEENNNLTQQGLVVGTATYMAPEQAFGLPVNARTDLYSTGIVLYELVTGRVPFEADTPMAALMKQAYEQPPRASTLRPGLPAQVQAILDKALAKEPDARYASAAEMAAAVREALDALRPTSAGKGDSLTGTYEAGVRAFATGQWQEAIARLTEVAEQDPGYEDVEALLESARGAHTGEYGPERVAAAVDAAAAAAAEPTAPDRAARAEAPPAPAPPLPQMPVPPAPVTPPVTPPAPAAAPAAAPVPPAPVATAAPAAPQARRPRRLGWLGVVVLLAVFALAGPAVVAARQLGDRGRGPAAVSMAGLAFRPGSITVAKGTHVVFSNDDVAPHTVTVDAGGLDSGVIAPGGTFSMVVSGTFTYRCRIHPSMKARVLVPT